ncbi:MAG: hypothetical protein IKV56_03940 [Kiritimatiellae bacterium]|nr:hypothetical protein [Kiritimatiellia bacterium]
MLKFFAVLLASVALVAYAEESRQKTDVEIWNEGVDFYRAGDVTNALQVLRPLMLSRTHGARAAEVVAKLEHDAALKPGATDALARLEEAAAAAQIALRAAPEDKRLNGNFTRAVSALPELRETARINAALESGKGKSPDGILKSSRDAIRKIVRDSGEMANLCTNDAVSAVAMADSMAAKCETLALNWLPVKEAICQSVTNEAELAEISKRVDTARVRTEEAAKLLGDMDDSSRYPLAEVEAEFTEFHKALVMPPDAADESLLCQSNAFTKAAEECARNWTRESLDYTRAFRMKFPAWAKAYEQQAAADTNKPPFKVEDQARISALATELEKLHLELVEKDSEEKRKKALECTEEIIKLLPRDNNSKGGNSQQNQNKNDQDKNDQNKKDESKDDNQSENQEDNSEDDSQNNEEKKDNQSEKEIENALKKAQERSDEHEAQKKAREMRRRLPPNERDW